MRFLSVETLPGARTLGQRLIETLDATEPAKAATLRREIFEENRLRQDFVLTRAIKA